MEQRLRDMENLILTKAKGKFTTITDPLHRRQIIKDIAQSIDPHVGEDEIDEMLKDMYDISPLAELIDNEDIEDIMINNTENIFEYSSKEGPKKVDKKIGSKEDLETFINKLKLYATNESSNGNILDIHLPNGSRANVVSSPMGYDVTVRNFKRNPLSILDIVNAGEIDYSIAARLWLYVDGLKVRPANILIGGMPAAGKTTLLNAMFSFFRPEARIVTIEETYELDTRTQENCVRLETSEDMPMVDLVKNALRMRPDMIIIGEVRGAEANDMITAMNIGKISMGTIHASSTRDIINRLQHTPMNVPMDIIPVIDALIVVSMVYTGGLQSRKVTQISEISGIETQILLSDLYKYDYKTQKGSPILPSVTYRDMLSKVLGVPPPDILEEERIRAIMLDRINRLGMRDMKSISEFVRDYYDNPEATLKKIGLPNLHPVIKV
ncbi:MAG: Flp pilus assembly complex ATPase component TadA [Candidatus Marsarchaeota archaeon]|nr:Flp pilus assembly complex ATPase component TadA [Candidatus Marsarchaeota archaeon]MCL5418805.1 Flp pilus assembly complex ATPase component TadA [Candidatus Marsarchaeota archaeon]